MMARSRQLRGQHADPRHAARRRRLERGPDRPGPPQGVGQPGAVDPAADEHDRQPPAEGDGPRVQPGAREAPRRRRSSLPEDAIVVCSFGDASANHATALVGHQHRALRGAHGPADADPVRLRGQRHRHQRADARGLDRGDVRRPAAPALRRGGRRARRGLGRRRRRRSTTSAARASRPSSTCERCACGATPAATPSRRYRIARRDRGGRGARSARCGTRGAWSSSGAATPDELRDLVRETRERVMAVAEEAARRPRLQTTEEVVAPMAPYHPSAVRERAAVAARRRRRARRPRSARTLPEDGRRRRTPARWPARSTPRWPTSCCGARSCSSSARTSGARAASTTSRTACRSDSAPARVFDTLLDETSILGIAQGAAHIGLLPVPEIQYLAYVHNALDQLRGEAASLQFFSSGQFRNPMVVRVPGLAYQKGFGGHFHNDNSVGALRDIPGLVLAAPARGDDAARMLRGAIAMAAEDGRVVVFLEPIALYHEKDLHADGDGGWLTDYPAPPEVLLPGEVGLYGDDRWRADVLLISYANGLRLSLQAAGASPRSTTCARACSTCAGSTRCRPRRSGRTPPRSAPCVVVDECRATGGGVADAIVADLAEQRDRRAARLGAGGRLVRAARARDRGRARRRGPDRRGRGRRRRQAASTRRRAIVMRAAVAFPGRGSYGPASLGSLPPGHPWVRRADELRARARPSAARPSSTAPSASTRRCTCARRTRRRSSSCAACSTPSASPTTTRSWSWSPTRPAGTRRSPPPARSDSTTPFASSRRWRLAAEDAARRRRLRAGRAHLPADRRRLAARPRLASSGLERRARPRPTAAPPRDRPRRVRGHRRHVGRASTRSPAACRRYRSRIATYPLRLASAGCVAHAAASGGRRGGREPARRPRLGSAERDAHRRARRPLHAVVDRSERAGASSTLRGQRCRRPTTSPAAFGVALREYAPDVVLLPGPGGSLGDGLRAARRGRGLSRASAPAPSSRPPRPARPRSSSRCAGDRARDRRCAVRSTCRRRSGRCATGAATARSASAVGEAWLAFRTPDGPATLRLRLAAPMRLDARPGAMAPSMPLDGVPALIGEEDRARGAHRHAPDRPPISSARHPGLRLPRTAPRASTRWCRSSSSRRSPAPRPSARTRRCCAPTASRRRARRPPPAAGSATLAGLPYHAYHPFGVERRRADVIRRAAARAAWLEAAGSAAEATSRLRSLPGIGPWTAAEVVRCAFGDPDAVSVGDYHIPNSVAWALAGEPRADDARMLELLEPYRGQRGRVQRLLEVGADRRRRATARAWRRAASPPSDRCGSRWPRSAPPATWRRSSLLARRARRARPRGDRDHAGRSIGLRSRRPGVRVEVAGPHADAGRIAAVAAEAAGRAPLEQVAVLRDFHLADGEDHYRRLRDAAARPRPRRRSTASTSSRTPRSSTPACAGRPRCSTRSCCRRAARRRRACPPLGPLNRLAWWMLDRILARAGRPLDELLVARRQRAARPAALPGSLAAASTSSRCSPSIIRVPPDLPAGTTRHRRWLDDRAGRSAARRSSRPSSRMAPPPIVIAFGSMAGASEARPRRRRALASSRRVGGSSSRDRSPRRRRRRACSASERSTIARSSRAPRSSSTTVAPAPPTPSCAAGVPSVVIPHVGDQPYWADRLHRLGVAPEPQPVRGLQAERLAAAALATAADPAMRQRARALASELEQERGLDDGGRRHRGARGLTAARVASPAKPRCRHRGSRATRVSTNGAHAYRPPGVRQLRVLPRLLLRPDRPAR